MNNKPSISVVMSVYNGEKYLSEAIESILNQTFRDFKFIIIDDGSKDSSLTIVEDFQKKDDRIVLIKNKENIGLPTSLNKGIKLARGKYIARQDADDMSVHNRLEKQFDFMENNPNVDILGCDNYRIDVDGYIFSEATTGPDPLNVKPMLLSRKTLFAHGTVIIRRGVFNDVGLYNQSFNYTQDCEYWMRCYLKGKRIEKLKGLLYKYRVTTFAKSMQSKVIMRDRLNDILLEAFRKGLISGMLEIDNTRVRCVIKDFENHNVGMNRADKSENNISGYWFHIARQALKSGKQKTYVRKCLYKSLNTKDTYYRYMVKIAFLILTYLKFDYTGINTSKFKKLWS